MLAKASAATGQVIESIAISPTAGPTLAGRANRATVLDLGSAIEAAACLASYIGRLPIHRALVEPGPRGTPTSVGCDPSLAGVRLLLPTAASMPRGRDQPHRRD